MELKDYQQKSIDDIVDSMTSTQFKSIAQDLQKLGRCKRVIGLTGTPTRVNVGTIGHVDHGKSTLTRSMLEPDLTLSGRRHSAEYDFGLVNDPTVEAKTRTGEDILADIRSMKEMLDNMDYSKLEARTIVLMVGDEKHAQEVKDAIMKRDHDGELRFDGREISIVVCGHGPYPEGVDAYIGPVVNLPKFQGLDKKRNRFEGRIGKGQRKSNRQDRWK